MLIPVLLFIVGLLCLIKGGDWFVDGATGIARRFKVPELLIGATVVSIGTTLPEVMVSTTSAMTGHGEIAYGNAIGSVICNAALIAAITIAVRPGKVDPKSLRVPVLFFFVAAALYAGVAYTTGYFSRPIGIVLLAMFVAYMVCNVLAMKNAPAPEEDEDEPEKEMSFAKEIGLLILGAALIAVGANLLVDNGTLIAQALGVPESVIALTFVALGTSLPELVTAITSLAKGHGSLSLGNVIGANVFNLVLVGERLSIITSKAQTTRHRIMGIVNGDDFQIVYSDTPGILNPNYKLQESMMRFVRSALSDADVLLYVTDVFEKPEDDNGIVSKIAGGGTKTILVINKIDLTTQETLDALVERWRKVLPDAEIVPVSALNNFNIGGLFDRILAALPEGEPYYPKDTLTDKTLRFFASEIIREKILLNYQKEIPYCTEVVIDEYKEDADMDRIAATIYVARESQKGIVIGHQGGKLKKVGTEAREELEQFLDKKVFLKLYVKVNDNWRNDERQLRRFGYIES